MAINLDAEAESDLQPQSAPAKKLAKNTRQRRDKQQNQPRRKANASVFREIFVHLRSKRPSNLRRQYSELEAAIRFDDLPSSMRSASPQRAVLAA